MKKSALIRLTVFYFLAGLGGDGMIFPQSFIGAAQAFLLRGGAGVSGGGNLIDASTTYCAANGGGDGSSGTPWQDHCIVAAVNAASDGDTVYLAPGNWALNTSVATFTGAISGGHLNVSGVTGTIAVGQTVNGDGFAYDYSPQDFPSITGTCGANCWTIDNDSISIASEAMNAGYPVNVQKNVNIRGGGSGNTFDAYGHPSNGYTASASAFYASITPAGSITRVYTTGPTYPRTGAGGFIQLYGGAGSSSTGETISNLFVDGSQAYNGGGPTGTLVLHHCSGCVVDNIRLWGPSGLQGGGETQFAINNSVTPLVKNSIFAEPPLNFAGPYYPQGETYQTQFNVGLTNLNNLFYQSVPNPIDEDSTSYIGNAEYNITDALGLSQFDAQLGMPACPPISVCPTNGGTTGNYHFFVRNNYLDAIGTTFGTGGGVNDPGSTGQLNDIAVTGNWILANKATISSCDLHIFAGLCISGLDTGLSGMQINCASPPCNDQFLVSNNSIIASGAGSVATLDATGTGVGYAFDAFGASFTGAISGTTLTVSSVSTGSLAIDDHVGGVGVSAYTQITAGSGSTWTVAPSQTVDSEALISGHDNQVYGFNATQNYLSSASNQYLTDANSIDPSQSSNYCDTSTFSGCNTSGFTTSPTCSFALGMLSGSIVPFASTSFAAQYGAVQWIASTSSTTPLSNDARWNNNNANGVGGVSGGNSYIPPVSLASVSHGNTVYVWVMDSVNHIASCGSASI